MTCLVVELKSGKRIVADGSTYDYLAMELIGDELGPIRLSLHGHRMVAENQMEVVHWTEHFIDTTDHIALALAQEAVPAAPERVARQEISAAAIERELDALSRELEKFRGPAKPRATRVSGALRFRVATNKHPELLLTTAAEAYVQINGVWSGDYEPFAMEGRSFSADENGQAHSHRAWFKDTLRIGERATVEVERVT